MTVAALTQYESVRLFTDRAVAAQPAFALTEKNAPAIAEICHTLDGIPLALELAAARVRALPVEAIAARLSDRFRLLTGGDKTSLPRQQTLRALHRLELRSALGNRAGDAAPARRIRGRLDARSGGTGGGGSHRRSLGGRRSADESRREVAGRSWRRRADATACSKRSVSMRRSAWSEAGEKSQTRTRHLAFFLDLAEQATPHLMGPEQGAWLERLDIERENILVAHSGATAPSAAASSGCGCCAPCASTGSRAVSACWGCA